MFNVHFMTQYSPFDNNESQRRKRRRRLRTNKHSFYFKLDSSFRALSLQTSEMIYHQNPFFFVAEGYRFYTKRNKFYFLQPFDIFCHTILTHFSMQHHPLQIFILELTCKVHIKSMLLKGTLTAVAHNMVCWNENILYGFILLLNNIFLNLADLLDCLPNLVATFYLQKCSKILI